MRVCICEQWTTVGKAPVGLLLLADGEIICKSEYKTQDNSRCDCIIISSGEAYYGMGDAAGCRPMVLQ